ncbi:hypothetical protein MMA231_00937 [Asticcacaulis sp. MM231]|uniref:DNA-binding domain-containing protein n=1 Tax=Asticcacaulis sp. MM231 TaxID=3157666 RepID=UPI0032D58BAB
MTSRETPTLTQADPLWDAFKADYFRPGAPTFAACYARLEAMAESNGMVAPSKETLRRRLQLHLEMRMGAERSQAMPDLARLAEYQQRDLELDGIEVKYPKPGSLLTGRHNLHTQQGKNRFKKETDQLVLVEMTPEEKALRALYKKLNYFPTPPWATRALITTLPDDLFADVVGEVFALDPCAGRCHMVDVVREFGFNVTASDIHDHGMGYAVQDFLTAEYPADADVLPFDAVFMNPPFSLDEDRPGEPTIADKFIAKALTLANDVFVFGRLAFLTPAIRYELMRDHLEAMYVFCERVPIALGRISKKSGATDYAWYHFKRDADPLSHPATILIPPGTRDRLTRHGDDRS